MKKLVLFCITVLTTFCLTGGDFIRNGKTSYSIVIPDQPDTGVKFAAQELQTFLKKASGADFRIIKSAQAPEKNRIFLGISPAALKILKNDPRKGLKAQEHVVRTVGNDLFLYGQGTWGEMYAVYDYLENVLGYRWYDARGGMKVPDCRNLAKNRFLHSLPQCHRILDLPSSPRPFVFPAQPSEFCIDRPFSAG